jgi:hypothetical protein
MQIHTTQRWCARLFVDEGIAKQILRVVQSAAVEAAVWATEQESRHEDEVIEVLRRDLQAAR